MLVTNETDLRRVGTGTNGWKISAYYRQTADILLTSDWTSIGRQGSNVIYFTGIYDGGGFYIADLKIPSTSPGLSSYQGLFAYNSGTVKNVALRNVNINCSSFNDVGGIAGYNFSNGIIENCYVAGSIGGGFYVGGITGSNAGIIRNCYSTSGVMGLNYAGGIAGRNSGASARVEFCYATKAIILAGSNGGGGIVGNNGSGSTIQRCVALNTQIMNTIANTTLGRVTGVNAGTLTANYALFDMSVWYYTGSTFGNAPQTIGQNSKDGANISSTDYNSTSWWTSTFLTSTNWSFATNRLPWLKTTTGVTFPGQTPEM